MTEEHTGKSSSYYMIDIEYPTSDITPYSAECLDIIEALEMDFSEANIFKAIWRRAAHRQGKKKRGNNNLYDAEKIVFFANRILVREERENNGKL